MSSIVTAVFKATIGVLVNKGRDKAADLLKEGDVTDQKFRDFIVRDIDDIKSKLEGLARRDLLAAIDYFKVGLVYLYEGIDGKASGECSETTTQAIEEGIDEVSSPSPTVTVTTVPLAAGITDITLVDGHETTKQAFSYAKERFKLAREKATDAFNNEALSTFERITAIRYRVMATMLETAAETVGSVSDLSSLSFNSVLKSALPECSQCLENLHSMHAVQNCFKVELKKGLSLKGLFNKDERGKIISTVCQLNRAVYDVMQTIGEDVHLWISPFVDVGEDKIDPLRDSRVTKKLGTENCYVTPRLFGQEGIEQHRVKHPTAITTNTQGHYLIADRGDSDNLKGYDSSGNFLFAFEDQQDDDIKREMSILDIATDRDDNVYLLVGRKAVRSAAKIPYKVKQRTAEEKVERVNEPKVERYQSTKQNEQRETVQQKDSNPVEFEFKTKQRVSERDQVFVFVLSCQGYLRYTFPLTSALWCYLTVNDNNKVLALKSYRQEHRPYIQEQRAYSQETVRVIDVYETYGGFVRSFQESRMNDPSCMSAASDGRIMLMDRSDSSVHVISEMGEHLYDFKVEGSSLNPRMAYHRPSEQVVVAGEKQEEGILRLQVFTKDGTFIRSIEINAEEIYTVRGLSVTTEGKIAVAYESKHSYTGKVLVV